MNLQLDAAVLVVDRFRNIGRADRAVIVVAKGICDKPAQKRSLPRTTHQQHPTSTNPDSPIRIIFKNCRFDRRGSMKEELKEVPFPLSLWRGAEESDGERKDILPPIRS